MPPEVVQGQVTLEPAGGVDDDDLTATVPSALTPVAPPLLFNGAFGSAPRSDTPPSAKATSGSAIVAAVASKIVRPKLLMCRCPCSVRARLTQIKPPTMSQRGDCLSPV